MDEGNRGTGVHSEVEEGYIQTCLELATHLLVLSRAEMTEKFQAHVATTLKGTVPGGPAP